MSTSTCLLPTISVSTEAISIQNNVQNNPKLIVTNKTTDKTSETDKLSRSFLDSKNSTLFAKSRIVSLKVRKIALDQEITKYHDRLLQYKDVVALEHICQMYKEYLTDLMREFLEVTQEITFLQNS